MCIRDRPWTYLAFNNIQPLLAETGAEVTWRPFLVGGVFNAVNPSVYQARAEPMDPKIVHNYRWLHEWAQVAGLPLVFPTAHHPVKSVLAMRACCVLEQDQPALQHFSKAAFDAYFARGENIDEPDVIQAIADDCGLDGASLISGTAEQSIKALMDCSAVPLINDAPSRPQSSAIAWMTSGSSMFSPRAK